MESASARICLKKFSSCRFFLLNTLSRTPSKYTAKRFLLVRQRIFAYTRLYAYSQIRPKKRDTKIDYPLTFLTIFSSHFMEQKRHIQLYDYVRSGPVGLASRNASSSNEKLCVRLCARCRRRPLHPTCFRWEIDKRLGGRRLRAYRYLERRATGSTSKEMRRFSHSFLISRLCPFPSTLKPQKTSKISRFSPISRSEISIFPMYSHFPPVSHSVFHSQHILPPLAP